MNRDLIIIGAGPAGLGAAIQARKVGLSVLVVDEQGAPGGQIYRNVERVASHDRVRAAALGEDYLRGTRLVQEFRECGADYQPGTLVWQIESGRVSCLKDGAVASYVAPRILIATGAIERPVARPGWTLPGVLSAGGAQILLKTSGIIPSNDVVLMGNGPLLYLLASQILKTGGRIQAIVETVPAKRYFQAAPHLFPALGAGYLGKGLKMLVGLRRSGVKMYQGASDLEILGGDKAREVRFRYNGRRIQLQTGTVILHEGVIPNQQITRLANCAHHWDSHQQCFVPDHDEWGNTSIRGVMVAGDGAGIGGAVAAEAAGRLSALEAAHAHGRLTVSQRDKEARGPRASYDALVNGRRFLEILYAPSEAAPVGENTLVCRCEEITAGQIRQAVAIGNIGPNQVKSYLRCGMGPCQGRMCGPTISALIASERGVSPDDVGYFRIRPPLKPIPIQALAGAHLEGAGTP